MLNTHCFNHCQWKYPLVTASPQRKYATTYWCVCLCTGSLSAICLAQQGLQSVRNHNIRRISNSESVQLSLMLRAGPVIAVWLRPQAA